MPISASGGSLDFLLFLFLLPFLLILSGSEANMKLLGEDVKCEKNSRLPINVSALSLPGNRCLRCSCENSSPVCRLQQCLSLSTCSLIQPPTGDSCCPTCAPCNYLGRSHPDGSTWKSPFHPCTDMLCQSGIITTSRTVCVSACNDTLSLPGHCCPLCSLINSTVSLANGNSGKLLRIGRFSADPCIECRIVEEKLFFCSRKGCPVLNCLIKSKKSNECCPVCAPSTVTNKSLPKESSRTPNVLQNRRCYFQKKEYRIGQKFWVDDCSECECLDGGIMCRRFICPYRTCPLSFYKGICCGFCVRNEKRVCVHRATNGTMKVHRDGSSWSQSDCEMCKCSNGQVICHTQSCIPCHQHDRALNRKGECCPVCVKKDRQCTFNGLYLETFTSSHLELEKGCAYYLLKQNEIFHMLFHRRKPSSVRLSIVMFGEAGGRSNVDLIKDATGIWSRMNGVRSDRIVRYDSPSFTLHTDNVTVMLISNELGIKIRWTVFGFRISVAHHLLSSVPLQGACTSDTVEEAREWMKSKSCLSSQSP